ncbi:MAG: hypothetical protein DRJ47_04655 [Thermoprotei archaeon]|nr:MAG: hypothetical protein DRJ47_04655 [Thermoprotei archaeon]
MAYIGIEKEDSVWREEVRKLLDKLGLRLGKVDEIEIKTKRGWKTFIRIEIYGFVEGLANILSKQLKTTVFEWGEHTILGEVSAKLWYEAVRICYPDGDVETLPVLLCDGFLDAKIPSENVRGLKGVVYIGGLRIPLPIDEDNLRKILALKGDYYNKLERLIEAYGMEKILSSGAIRMLEEAKKGAKEQEERMEIDYEAGFVLKLVEGKITTIPLLEYIVQLILDGKEEHAVNVVNEAPKNIEKELLKELRNEAEYRNVLGRKDDAEKILKFLERFSK